MAFLDDVDRLRTKIHANGVPRPVLAGVAVLVLVVVVLVAWNAVGALQAAGAAKFEIERADVSTDKAESAQADSGEGGASGEGGGDPANEETAGTNVGGSDGASAAQGSTAVFVHVAGAVVAPGVYEVPLDARVQDAIAAAGGFADNAARDSVNCARTVQDGEQILVPTIEETQGSAGSAAGQSNASSGGVSGATGGIGASGTKVNINLASAEELDALPGVGPSTAAKIVADREANGKFETPTDLMRVSGIGEKKFEQLKSLITV